MDKIIEILKSKTYSISGILLKNYHALNITEEELIVLIYLMSIEGKIEYNPENIMSNIDMEKYKIMSILSSLEDKKIISSYMEKNNNVSEEYISLDLLYNHLGTLLLENVEKPITDSNIFETFESEFGRTLSPMEYEIIKGWINDKFTDEIILEALKESIYNGVQNLRYIDKILYEWNKKGLKNKKDVINDKAKRRDTKKNIDIPDYNWLDE